MGDGDLFDHSAISEEVNLSHDGVISHEYQVGEVWTFSVAPERGYVPTSHDKHSFSCFGLPRS